MKYDYIDYFYKQKNYFLNTFQKITFKLKADYNFGCIRLLINNNLLHISHLIFNYKNIAIDFESAKFDDNNHNYLEICTILID